VASHEKLLEFKNKKKPISYYTPKMYDCIKIVPLIFTDCMNKTLNNKICSPVLEIYVAKKKNSS